MTIPRAGFMALGLSLLTFWFLGRSQPANELRERVVMARESTAEALKVVAPAAVVTPGPALVAAPSLELTRPVPRSLQEFDDRLEQLNACMEGNCDYPDTDPHSYSFALGQDLKSNLLQMAEFVRGQRLNHEEIAKTARQFLSYTDGHVQEAALDLLATQPTSRENLESLVNNILQGADSELVDHALAELQRYTSTDDLVRINEGLAQALLTGAPFVAIEVSTRITPFLNDSNYPFFQELVTRLPEQSAYRLNLESSLLEYQRRRREG